MIKMIIVVVMRFATMNIKSQDQELVSFIRKLDQKNAEIIVRADTVELLKQISVRFTIKRTTGSI